MIFLWNKFHPKLDVSSHQFMDDSCTEYGMFLVINLWMILVQNKFHPKVDVSSHQFMDDSCTE